MTKLVKTSSAIEVADDFSKKLSAAIDEGLAKRESVVVVDTETSPWDDKERVAARRQAAKAFNFGVEAGLKPEQLLKLAEKLDAAFPEMAKYQKTLNLMARYGVTVDEVRVEAIAQRLEGDFSKMRRVISEDWSRLFNIVDQPAITRFIASVAVEKAKQLGVPETAETLISPCGCIWALQTVFNAGTGDIILRTCAEHSPKRKT